MPNVELRDLVINALEDRKGVDIQCLDVQGQTDITDYMIVASGTSGRQVKALADSVIEKTASIDIKPLGLEGMENGEWVLIPSNRPSWNKGMKSGLPDGSIKKLKNGYYNIKENGVWVYMKKKDYFKYGV